MSRQLGKDLTGTWHAVSAMLSATCMDTVCGLSLNVLEFKDGAAPRGDHRCPDCKRKIDEGG